MDYVIYSESMDDVETFAFISTCSYLLYLAFPMQETKLKNINSISNIPLSPIPQQIRLNLLELYIITKEFSSLDLRRKMNIEL